MSEVVFNICDCCGHYCVRRNDSGTFFHEPVVRVMLDGIAMHVCEAKCATAPHTLAKLIERRKLIAEQNAALDECNPVR